MRLRSALVHLSRELLGDEIGDNAGLGEMGRDRLI